VLVLLLLVAAVVDVNTFSGFLGKNAGLEL